MTNRKRVMPPRKYQYESRCRGTDFSRNGAIKSSHSNRSSSESRSLRQKGISGLLAPPHEDLIAAHLHLEAFQRTRRRARSVSPVQVVHAVMARTPHFVQIVAVLHRARQMRASRRHRAILSVGSANEQSGAIAKAKDFSAVRLQLSYPACDYRIAAQI